MSRVSIYETGWLNLVFEGRNKEYGAYQLRQENPKTTIFALFAGFMLLATLVSIPMVINYFSANQIEQEVPIIDGPITTVNFNNPLPNTPKTQTLPIIKEKEPEAPKPDVPLKDPVIVKPSDANDNIGKNKDNPNPTPTTGTPGTGTPSTGTISGPPTTIPTVPTVDPNALVSTALLDKLPEYPGGLTKFREFVGNNFERPDSEDGKNVTVLVYFVIEKDGTLTDVKVTRDPGFGLGKEAVRVLKSSKTKWKPGIMAGKPVRTAYTLPITVRM
ncbi:MAG: energy transducer TonB [Bacteroidota bacterium]